MAAQVSNGTSIHRLNESESVSVPDVRLHEEEGVEEDGGDEGGEHGPHLQRRPVRHRRLLGAVRSATWGANSTHFVTYFCDTR